MAKGMETPTKLECVFGSNALREDGEYTEMTTAIMIVKIIVKGKARSRYDKLRTVSIKVARWVFEVSLCRFLS